MLNSTLSKFILLCGLCITMTTARAQYFAIPDTNFGNWLYNNGYASCMIGNSVSGYQLDTICSDSFEYNAGILDLSNQNISDLTGLQYISWQESGVGNYGIDLSNNNLTSFPTQLYPFMGNYDYRINLDYNHIDTVVFDVNFFYVSELDINNNGMHLFTVDHNSCGACNTQLGGVDVSYNNLDTFPSLWSVVGPFDLSVRGNHLTSMPGGNLNTLDCGVNRITAFGGGVGLVCELWVDSNLLTSMDLTGVSVANGGIMYKFDCSHNALTSITNMQFTSMSLYGNTGTFLCNDNNLTSLPPYPSDVAVLDCHNNPNLQCIPIMPNVPAFNLNFSNTSVQCLPRLYPYCVYTSTPAITSVPTCDLYNNTYGCPQYSNLAGYVYITDTSHSCVIDSTERLIQGVKAQFLNGGNIAQEVYSDYEGHYSFDQLAYGTYTLQVDTSFLPIAVVCPDSAYYTATVDSPNFYQSGFNFGMNCKAGFDIGDQGAAWSAFLPHQNSYVTFFAGDMSELYGLHCAAGMSGQVQISYSGPINFVAANTIVGGLPPASISGDTLTWAIADFGTVDINTAFALIFYTDSTAQLNDNVCFSIAVTPVAGDNNPSNNYFYFCDQVHVSYDPNEKIVYPAGDIDTNVQWLTYTIHFQNTGTGPAQNVMITDTLSSYLDPTTFQLLNYSYKNVTQISGSGVVVFNFPGINLPDSATSQTASRGYVQYKIKLKKGLPLGTRITNTANIYFDFNSPVVTNTTVNVVDTPNAPLGIKPIANAGTIHLYPNPNKGSFTLETSGGIGSEYTISDMLGSVIAQQTIKTDSQTIDLPEASEGVYALTVRGAQPVRFVVVR